MLVRSSHIVHDVAGQDDADGQDGADSAAGQDGADSAPGQDGAGSAAGQDGADVRMAPMVKTVSIALPTLSA